MRSAILNDFKRVAPLQSAFAKVFEGKIRRTKKAATAVSLLHLSGPEEQAAFKEFQAAIMESMTLKFPDPDKRICVLTDASDRFYAGLVTQIDEEQLDLRWMSKTTSSSIFVRRVVRRATTMDRTI
jgi:hypothetical protein